MSRNVNTRDGQERGYCKLEDFVTKSLGEHVKVSQKELSVIGEERIDVSVCVLGGRGCDKRKDN